MKNLLVMTLLPVALAGAVQAQKVTKPAEPKKSTKNDPVPLVHESARKGDGAVFRYPEQRAFGRGEAHLVSPEQAADLIERFGEAYTKMGAPRVVIYVNRELVDQEGGLQLSARSERRETEREKDSEGERVKEKREQKNTYRVGSVEKRTLTDRQTTRDIERLLGRPLRMAGVNLADSRAVSQLLDSSVAGLDEATTEGSQAQRDREALKRVADVALEVLLSSKEVTVQGLTGARSYQVPDLQLTALRLSDGRILGQATSADLMGDGGEAARVGSRFDVRDITEATALALMEDMMLGQKTGELEE